MDSLRKAAAHLPRVDAIGGSAAGVYVNNRVRGRGVGRISSMRTSGTCFSTCARPGTIRGRERRRGDGARRVDVARRERDSRHRARHQHGGRLCDAEGNITSWLNELAFVPIDYNPDAAVDEWSGDYGVGSQYSRSRVGRLMPAAGIDAPADLGLPERLKIVQALRAMGDARPADLRHHRHLPRIRRRTVRVVLRSPPRPGSRSRDVRRGWRRHRPRRAPGPRGRVSRAGRPHRVSRPNEHDKRHGQAIAAASLPSIAS